MGEKLLTVTVLSPELIIFQGKAERVIVPGESGVFEILPFHKRILSRLLSGTIIIDAEYIPIYRGIIQAGENSVTIIMEKNKEE
ncbi:MAG: hypothetical protein KKF93_07425 [Candidatus Omnitrophica bacterium]|nr:hypothetical protein [Candidatus Omnitrophota bacterium]